VVSFVDVAAVAVVAVAVTACHPVTGVLHGLHVVMVCCGVWGVGVWGGRRGGGGGGESRTADWVEGAERTGSAAAAV
jgi:hypothetical protein